MLEAEMKRVQAASPITPDRRNALAQARRRAAQRREAIEAGLIT